MAERRSVRGEDGNRAVVDAQLDWLANATIELRAGLEREIAVE